MKKILLISGIIIILGIIFWPRSNTPQIQKASATEAPIVFDGPQSPIPVEPSSPYPSFRPNTILDLSKVSKEPTKVYQNSKMDITLMYPPSLILTEDAIQKQYRKDLIWVKSQYPNSNSKIEEYPHGVVDTLFNSPDTPIEIRGKPGFDFAYYGDNTMRIYLEVYDNPQNLLPLDFLTIQFKGIKSMDNKTNEIDVIKQQSKATNTPKDQSILLVGALGENPQKIVYFTYKNKFYSIELEGGNNTGEGYSDNAEKIFDQIVASIKFQ